MLPRIASPVEKPTMKIATAPKSPVRVLMSSALRRRPEFMVRTCALEPESILQEMESSPADVVLLDGNHQGNTWTEMALLRRIHIAFPSVAKVLLLENLDREVVVNAFRSGARGLFSFAASS